MHYTAQCNTVLDITRHCNNTIILFIVQFLTALHCTEQYLLYCITQSNTVQNYTAYTVLYCTVHNYTPYTVLYITDYDLCTVSSVTDRVGGAMVNF